MTHMYLEIETTAMTEEEVQHWLDGTTDKHECELVSSHAVPSSTKTAFIFRRPL